MIRAQLRVALFRTELGLGGLRVLVHPFVIVCLPKQAHPAALVVRVLGDFRVAHVLVQLGHPGRAFEHDEAGVDDADLGRQGLALRVVDLASVQALHRVPDRGSPLHRIDFKPPFQPDVFRGLLLDVQAEGQLGRERRTAGGVFQRGLQLVRLVVLQLGAAEIQYGLDVAGEQALEHLRLGEAIEEGIRFRLHLVQRLLALGRLERDGVLLGGSAHELEHDRLHGGAQALGHLVEVAHALVEAIRIRFDDERQVLQAFHRIRDRLRLFLVAFEHLFLVVVAPPVLDEPVLAGFHGLHLKHRGGDRLFAGAGLGLGFHLFELVLQDLPLLPGQRDLDLLGLRRGVRGLRRGVRGDGRATQRDASEQQGGADDVHGRFWIVVVARSLLHQRSRTVHGHEPGNRFADATSPCPHAQTGSAVVFFTVRKASVDCTRTTPGNWVRISVWIRSKSAASA